jgi:hypothetical protein
MRKAILSLSLLLACIGLFAQNSDRWTFNVNESNVIGSFEEDWGGNIFEVNFVAYYNVTPKFHIGVGAGVGSADIVKYHSSWELDTDKKDNIFSAPVFAKIKYDFGSKPTHLYVTGKIGTRIGSVEGYDGETFNPFIYNIAPALGVDINVGGGNKITIEAGIEANGGRYEEVNFKYSDVLNKYVYSDFEKKSDNSWAGIYISVGFSF